MSRFAPAVAAAAVCLALVGCGPSKPPTYPVTGKVMFRKTTPAAGALVVFHPVDPAVEKMLPGKPFAKCNDDGTFTLTTYSDAPDGGAPEGEYGVTVQWMKEAKGGASKFKLGGEEGGGGSLSALHPKYGNPQQPFTKVTIKKGEKNEFHFEVD